MTFPTEPNQNTVYVWRSTDGGATWTLVRTIPAPQGFARNGTTDSYQTVAAPPGDADNVALLGMAGWDGTQTVQQFLWMSGDGGFSWLQNPNWAEPYTAGDWSINGPGGVTAFPGSRPVVVGAEVALSAQIVG